MEKIRPVFIGACQRSGTTMLGAMLGASPDAFTTPEAPFKFTLLGKDKILRQWISDSLLQDFRFKLWESELKSPKVFPEIATGKEIIELVLNRYQKENQYLDRDTWIDHTPTNIEYFFQLTNAYPDAKFIFLIRDGRAVMNSFFKLAWGPNTAYEAANKWLKANAFVLAGRLKYLDQSKIVFYENLVKEPANELKKICRFLDITYDEKMITGDRTFLPEYTKSQHSKVGDLPDAELIDRWKNTLKTKDIRIFEDIARPLLETLGYECLDPNVKIKLGDRYIAQVYSGIKRIFWDKWKNKIRKIKNS